ncbi:MAG: phosphotransferase [Kofleriaceae bacterium]|nr:phosphotransferase [Kofleriaceae bacterium]
MLQAADAFGLHVANNSVVWETKHVARVESADGLAYAFKHFRAPALATKESSILLHLASAAPQCNVQQLQRCENGDALAATDLGPMMASLWIEGARKPYDTIDAGGWTVLGNTLATLHQALESMPMGPVEDLSEEFLALDLDAERTRLVQDREALRSLGVPPEALALQDARLHLLVKHLGLCRSAWPAGEDQLIHNDYNVHNYIFGSDGKLSVIDWDRSVVAPREYEVVRCLNHLPLRSPSLASAFLTGYSEVLRLDAGRLEWAVHAAMVSHASKHWPTELALAGDPSSVERLVALEEIVSLLAQSADNLLSFFLNQVATKN